MKELKHLHALAEKLRAENEHHIANKIEKKAQDYYLAWATSFKKNKKIQ